MNKSNKVFKTFENAIEREPFNSNLSTEQKTPSNSVIMTEDEKAFSFIDNKIESHILTAELYKCLFLEELRICDNLIRCRTAFYDSSYNGFTGEESK